MGSAAKDACLRTVKWRIARLENFDAKWGDHHPDLADHAWGWAVAETHALIEHAVLCDLITSTEAKPYTEHVIQLDQHRGSGAGPDHH